MSDDNQPQEAAMSELLPCTLCQSKSFPMLAHGTVIHPTDKSRPCALNGIEVTPEQWTKLMGQGEPVAWAATDETGLVVEALGFNQSRRFDTPLYLAAPPQAQGDDVLRDAMRYRWLRENNRAESKAGLTLMDRLYDVDGDKFDMHVDAAMK